VTAGRSICEPSKARLTMLRGASTLLIVAGVVVCALLSDGASSVDRVFADPAPVLGAALALAFWTEATAGVRNLIRADIFMLAVLYVLTFLEFLFPQPDLSARVTLQGAQSGVLAVLVGFAGIALGRHLVAIRARIDLGALEFRPRQLFSMFLLAAFVGYFHMLWSVRFNPVDLVYWMVQPRFTQPWTRGRLGGWSSLLSELGLLIYLLPPLAGAVFAEARRYTMVQKAVVAAVLGFTLFQGFAGGTRSVLLVYIATFGTAYLLLTPGLTWRRCATLGAPALAIAWFTIYYLPEIRTHGLDSFDMETAQTSAVFVDLNVVNVSQLTEVFPDYAPYLGFEIPFTAIIRPIPRAIWPGKPEGLSFSIEDALGAGSQMTLSATFVGEFYMAGGLLAVALCALFLGWAAASWNRVGAKADTNAMLILYASGFFAAGLCMRSFMSVAPAILPTIALALMVNAKGKRVDGLPFR
jgi:oligosaccharide repeat unit polymerase